MYPYLALALGLLAALGIFWWGLRKTSSPLTRGGRPPRPRLTFELLPDGHVVATCGWPAPRGDEDAALGRSLGALAYCLNGGRLLASIQQAVAVEGRLRGEERFAAHVLGCLNGMLASKDDNAGGDDPARTGPVVPADEVFSR